MAAARFLDLPDHIVFDIATHLNRPDRISLALTCKTVRPAAEQAIWTHVNLSLRGARSSSYNDLDPGSNSVIGHERLLAIRELYIWGPDVTEQDRSTIQPLAFAEFMQELLDHLKSHPHWLKSIRRITVDVDRLLSKPFREFLRLVSDTLTRLEILPPEFPYGQLCTSGLLTPTQLFLTLDTKLTSLGHLHISLNEQWQDRLQAALSCTPDLTSLRLSPDSAYSGGWARQTSYESHNKARPFQALPYLQRLEVDEMHSQFSLALTALIRGSTCLNHVVLQDPSNTWQPTCDDPVIPALVQATQLDRLDLCESALGSLKAARSTVKVDTLPVGDS